VQTGTDAASSQDELASALRLAPLASPAELGFEIRGRF
jgi:hypothetical protein